MADDLQSYLTAGSVLAYPAAFIAGVLISFTPCVYPIIPIQLGFIGGQTAVQNNGDKRVSWRGFTLSALFVTGMAIVYASLGAFASLTGTLFGIWTSSPWTYLIVSNIILVLALSMLDLFQLPSLQLPASWSPKRQDRSHGTALLIGAVSGLVVGPCTAPALGTVLAYVGARGNLVFGATVLFVFALGMGTLMIALGTFSSALAARPRSGEWMVKIKKFYGIAMILIAEYLLLQAGQRFV